MGAGHPEGAGKGRVPRACGRRSQPSSAPGGRRSPQMLSAHPGAADSFLQRLADAGSRRQWLRRAGTEPEDCAPPGSSAQRWVSKLMRGGPEHHVPGRLPGVGASGVGIRWPGEGLVIWVVLGSTADFKGLLWYLSSGSCAGRGAVLCHVAFNS